MSRLCSLGRKLVIMPALLAATLHAQTPDSPDTILINGKVLTVDEDFSVVQALAVNDERISATGTTQAIRAQAGEETEVIDLEGATVVPGLIDNHFHFLRAVQWWHLQARLDGVDSREEALSILAEKAENAQAGEWIMVQGGWFPEQFADDPGGFTLAELDRVAPENPLFLQHRYSEVYANSSALEAVGLDPADGARRSAQGLATFQPPYGRLIQQLTPPDQEQLAQNLTDFMHTLNATGLTGVYSLGRGPEGEEEVLERRAAEGDLPLRIWRTLAYEAATPEEAEAAAELIRSETPDTFEKDFGTFGLGEHIYLPFFDLPGRTEPWPDEILDNYMTIARAAAEQEWHIHEHTIKDVSVRGLLDRFEALNEEIPLAPLRWTFAHVYNISPESIDRAKELGMTLGVHGAAMHAGANVPLRRIQDSSITFGLGTDATVVSHYQPFITLGWAVSGRDLAGNKVLDQTLNRREALIAHTRANARLFFQEDNLGTLEPGKYADLLVLDRDYMEVPAEEIMAIRPEMTMVGGRIVYREP